VGDNLVESEKVNIEVLHSLFHAQSPVYARDLSKSTLHLLSCSLTVESDTREEVRETIRERKVSRITRANVNDAGNVTALEETRRFFSEFIGGVVPSELSTNESLADIFWTNRNR
jgi:hypothetical protein